MWLLAIVPGSAVLAMASSGSTMDVPAVVQDGIAAVASKAGFKKPRFHIESGSNAGDGYTSIIYRAIIHDEDTTGADEMRLICKTTLSDTGNMVHDFLFDAESVLYSTIVPVLMDVAKLKEPLPWPKCFHANTTSARPCLVLEDKCVERFRMANRRVPLDEHHARHAVTQLGRFHGATMAMALQRPAEFDALADRLTAPYRTDAVRTFWKSWMLVAEETPAMMLERYPEGTAAHAKVKRFFSTFGDKYFSELMTPGKGVGNSIMHGDCHVNNMLFQYDEAGAVTGCCLIDFQTARFSHTALDLGTLLLSCTEKAMRDRHWDDLLKHYHTVLQNTLRDAGIKDPDTVYSWDQFVARLGDMAGFGLFLTPLLVHGMGADEEQVKELQSSCATVLSEDDPAATAGVFKIKWTSEVRRRVGDVIDDVMRWGWM
ncbi:uncharacterized protein LOC117651857 [Thrips palmi]|uniref:Uncharacterized protein LOC117651857 n=1 Tax=Thrips palmi TaxID=161013 RepID=A0A6P9A423_THRPL|nr:uncharacterized protein LOC117651857 [Thrips palmi]